MLRVGLIGCGGMGSVHARAYEKLKDKARIAAVADVVTEKREEMRGKYHCTAYETGMALIENAEVDFVDICVPTYLHTEHAIAAMRKGFDVFVEKPLCLTREEGYELYTVQKATGKKVQVGQVVRFMNEWRWLKAAVDDNRYGKLNFARFFRLSPTPLWGWENWFMDAYKSGGAALDLHLHDVDFVRYAFGDEIKDMKSVASKNKDNRIDHIVTTFDYDGSVVVIEGGWDLKEKAQFSAGYEAYFEDATVTFREGKLCVCTNEKTEEIDFTEIDAEDTGINVKAGSAYAVELEWFVDKVLTDKGENIVPLLEGLKSVQLVLDEIEQCKGAIKKCL